METNSERMPSLPEEETSLALPDNTIDHPFVNSEITDGDGRIVDPGLAEAMAYGEKYSREKAIDERKLAQEAKMKADELKTSTTDISNSRRRNRLLDEAERHERITDHWIEMAQLDDRVAEKRGIDEGLKYLIEQEWLSDGWRHGIRWEPFTQLRRYYEQLEHYLGRKDRERIDRVMGGTPAHIPAEDESLSRAGDTYLTLRQVLDDLYYLPQLGEEMIEHQTEGTLDQFLQELEIAKEQAPSWNHTPEWRLNMMQQWMRHNQNSSQGELPEKKALPPHN